MIRLEKLMEEDYDRILRWNQGKHSDFLLQWAGPLYEYPLTRDQLDRHVRSDEQKVMVYRITEKASGDMIGTIELKLLPDGRTGRAGRFLIGEAQARGKGYGQMVLNELVRIGFKEHQLEALTLGVFDFNLSAVRCYEHTGFVIVEHKPAYRQALDGQWGLYEMRLNREDWKKCGGDEI